MQHSFLLVVLGIACAILAPTARAQGVLAPNTVVVVTTDGFFVPDPTSATPRLVIPAATLTGKPALTTPSVEWEGNHDSFLVASLERLVRVQVLGLQPPLFTITDLTPATEPPLRIMDLERHPGSGELFVLDQTQDVALRFAPPFAAGMTPIASHPVGPTARSLCLDSRSHPNALTITESSQLTRVPLDGSPASVTTFVNFADGLDHDPQWAGKAGTFFAVRDAHVVAKATNNVNLVVSLNQMGFCDPLALDPVDVEWNPLTRRAFALAEGGINPLCFGTGLFASGGNHVVRFPLAQGPVQPTLATFAHSSGITGTHGDLALVKGDFAFIAPYGAPCGPGGAGPVLGMAQDAISTESTSATLALVSAPAAESAWLLIGAVPALGPLPGGCTLLVAPVQVALLGITGGGGALTLDVALSPLPLGLDVYLQAAVDTPAGPTLSEGLQIHVGD